MSVLASIARTNKVVSFSSHVLSTPLRAFSTALTAEELQAGAEKVARHNKFMQSTTSPKSLVGG